jgi:hypothetical protein
MNYTDLGSREQATYSAQCRTLVQALTTIPVQVEFTEAKSPAAMHYEKRTGRGKMVIDKRMPVDALAGLVIHECGHVLATTHKHFEAIAKKCEGETPAYINIVEDYRIEYGVIARYFPWAMQYLREATDIIAGMVEADLSMPSMIVNNLFKQQIPQSGSCDPDMFGDAIKYVEEWGPSIISAEETRDLEAAALALQALDKKHGKQQPPEDKSGQGKGDADAEGKRRASAYGAASDAVAEEKDERAKEGDEAMMKPRASKGDERHELSPVRDQLDGFRKAYAHLFGMRNRLADAIISSDLGDPRRYTKRGQLDCRRIAYAMTTDRVFQQPYEAARKVNTAIDIVIDSSGSMSHSDKGNGIRRAHIAAATAYMLGSSISRIPGTQVGVACYGMNSIRLHPIRPMRGIPEHEGASWARAHQNEDTDAAVIESARSLLRVRNVERRICLVITDDVEARAETISSVDKLGVETYCLCVTSEGQNTERVKHCPDIAQLPNLVAGLVQSMLANSRRQWVA